MSNPISVSVCLRCIGADLDARQIERRSFVLTSSLLFDICQKGDSVHAFPPDIGQGINAGLTDVEALDRALLGQDLITGEQGTPPATLGDALKTYEKVHSPEVAAVIRLARFGSPYQYKQPLYKDRVGRFFWTANVAFRMLLNKLSFGLIPNASILLVQNTNLTYRQVMRRADLTTAGITTFFAAILWKVLSRFFKPG